jgi:threonine/homoserine/homoserine lactone efflux protein
VPELHTLVIFSAAVLGLLLAPGPNMAFLFAHSLAHGPRGGLAVATGIFIADLGLSALTAAGVTAMVMALPASFDAIRVAGALYLLWLAVRSFRAQRAESSAVRVDASLARVVRRATINSLFNPKALLFFLVFLPQFVDPRRGNVAAQLAVLGTVLSLEALVFHALLGVSSGSLAHGMRSPRTRLVLGRLQGLVFLGLAVRLLVMGRPTTA